MPLLYWYVLTYKCCVSVAAHQVNVLLHFTHSGHPDYLWNIPPVFIRRRRSLQVALSALTHIDGTFCVLFTLIYLKTLALLLKWAPFSVHM